MTSSPWILGMDWLHCHTMVLNRSRAATLAFCLTLSAVGVVSGCNKPAEVPAEPISQEAPKPPAGAVSLDGAAIFAQSCSGCHGDKGVGGKRAPILAGKKLVEAETVTIVSNGKGKRMPPFKGRLSDDQIKAVAKYVATL
jgi:cytochrome c551